MTPIQTYNQTWEMYVRMMRYTTRRADFMPYCTLKLIDSFIRFNHLKTFIDWGCGENNHKIVYECNHMIGIDRTCESDIYGYPTDVWDDIPIVDTIIAINSIHFSTNVFDTVEQIVDKKLNHGGEILFTINNTGHAKAEKYASIDKWSRIGTVRHYWFTPDHEDDLVNNLGDYLREDQIFNNKKLDWTDAFNQTYAKTIKEDPFHGLLRVRLQK